MLQEAKYHLMGKKLLFVRLLKENLKGTVLGNTSARGPQMCDKLLWCDSLLLLNGIE